MKRSLLLLALSGIQLVPGQVKDHFSHATLIPPAGWSRSETSGWVLFTPPGLQPGQTVWIGVSPGGPSARDLAEEFGDFVKISANGMTTVNSGEVQMGTDAQGLKTIRQSVILQDTKGQKHVRLYLANRNGDRFESMVYTSSDPDLAVKYLPLVQEFLKNRVFDGAASPAAAPAPAVAPPPPAAPAADAPVNIRERYGARSPTTCASRKEPAHGAPSAEQATRYFICDNESLVDWAYRHELHLVTDAHVEVGKGRPFDITTDHPPSNEGINPGEPVYPIRGSAVTWTCGPVGASEPGKNCMKYPQTGATGECYKQYSGDWHCRMFGHGEFVNAVPPPQ